MTKPVTPCNNICRYEEIDGTPRCTSCFRTYEDLERWFYMDNIERRARIKQLKKERKQYEEAKNKT